MSIFRNVSIVILVTLSLAACQTSGLGTLKRSLNNTSYGYLKIDDSTGSSPNPVIEKFEVRAGDCASSGGWSDCKQDRERSELASSPISGETWVHWSIYLPNDYPIIYPVKVALGQFHQKSGHVVWMFQNHRGGYYVDNQTIGKTLHTKPVLDDTDMRGKWNDILVHAKWTSSDEGFFHVYVNGETKPRYVWFGKTQSPGKQVYFKYGVYRSFMSRTDGPDPTQIVYYTDVAASSDCDKVAKRFNCKMIEADYVNVLKKYQDRQKIVDKARQSEGKILDGQNEGEMSNAACKDPAFAAMLPSVCGK